MEHIQTKELYDKKVKEAKDNWNKEKRVWKYKVDCHTYIKTNEATKEYEVQYSEWL